MPISDYAHWNEDAPRIWWEEEGRHVPEPCEPDWESAVHYDDGPTHDGQSEPDVCIAEGNFSTRDGVIWRCDGCDDSQEFVDANNGVGDFNFVLKGD